MTTIQANNILDAKGLACPMPIIRTKKAIGELEPGQVMEVQATDKGSTADLQAWARSTGHQYIGTVQEGDVLKHYLRKATPGEEQAETQHPHVIDLETLQQKIIGNESITILDVREPAEYTFGHIPGSLHIPLGELEKRFEELNPKEEIYVVCRSGHRSDVAAQTLAKKGFSKVTNVNPGMASWEGPVKKH